MPLAFDESILVLTIQEFAKMEKEVLILSETVGQFINDQISESNRFPSAFNLSRGWSVPLRDSSRRAFVVVFEFGGGLGWFSLWHEKSNTCCRACLGVEGIGNATLPRNNHPEKFT